MKVTMLTDREKISVVFKSDKGLITGLYKKYL